MKSIEVKTSTPRILIVKKWAFGDILLATPLLRALKSGFPDCEITWLVDKSYVGAVLGNPLIDHVIAFDSQQWRKHFRYGNIVSYLKMSSELVRDLKSRTFDIVINLTAEKWWALWFNQARIKIGLFPRQRPGLMGKMYDIAIPRSENPRLHNSEHYSLPAVALGLPKPSDMRIVVGISDSDREAAQKILRDNPAFDASRPSVILHPGTSQSTKRWLPEHFAEVCQKLTGHNIILTGNAIEWELCEQIGKLAGRPVVIAAGEGKTLGEAAALIEISNSVVSGDTVILHVASALDRPLVAIFGSTRPRDNAPLFGWSRLLFDDTVPCAPCYNSTCRMTGDAHMGCMKGIGVGMVMDALAELGVSHPSRVASPPVRLRSGQAIPGAREGNDKNVN